MCSRHPQSLRTNILTNVASNKLTVKVVGFFVPLLGIKVFRGPALLAAEFHIVKHYKIYKWKACKHEHLLSLLYRSACNQQNLRLHNLENMLTSCGCTIIDYCLGTPKVQYIKCTTLGQSASRRQNALPISSLVAASTSTCIVSLNPNGHQNQISKHLFPHGGFITNHVQQRSTSPPATRVGGCLIDWAV